jgi:hypothetical protein
MNTAAQDNPFDSPTGRPAPLFSGLFQQFRDPLKIHIFLKRRGGSGAAPHPSLLKRYKNTTNKGAWSMAKVNRNIFLDGVSGMVGKQMVIKRMRGGGTILTNKPTFSADRVFSEDQLSHQQVFRLATAYGKLMKREPIYLALAEGTSRTGLSSQRRIHFNTIRNIANVFSGVYAEDFAVEVQTESQNFKAFTFAGVDGSRLIAIWTDGIAVNDDTGIPSIIVLPGFSGWNATGIDILNGFEQKLISNNENGNLVFHDLLIKDYPIIIRLSK